MSQGVVGRRVIGAPETPVKEDGGWGIVRMREEVGKAVGGNVVTGWLVP